MNEIVILPFEIEETISHYIQEKFEQENLRASFQNPLLREDMLELLDRYCTVVYYPIQDKSNNGFRLKEMPFADGSRHDFVFINTAQTVEKQVFTAAHELGHLWNVDEFVIQKHHLTEAPDLREHIINRFAAVLLMPADKFLVAAKENLRELGDNEQQSITYINLLKMIVVLMNQFSVPMKAVVLRLIETKIFRMDMAHVLFGHGEIPAEVFTKLIGELCAECGYTNLIHPTNKKWIAGLAQMLNIAEQKNLVSPNKIKVMREKFDLQPASSTTPGLNNVISLSSPEGQDA